MIGMVQRFIQRETSSGIVLGIAAVVAMVLANSSWVDAYGAVLHRPLGPFTVSQWISDVLMSVFFFVVGMEIKHELMEGALASKEKATLPIVAALGGMILPASIYAAFNHGLPSSSGWGVPMATDIAFAVGVLTLIGRRVPAELKIFLLALAIADDLGAVLVIALFYGHGIEAVPIVLAASIGVAIHLLAKKGVRHAVVHLALGGAFWWFVHASGLHATVAGCVLGFLMPHDDSNPDDPTPLERWVERLHPIVGFFIMPIFALANAGLVLSGVDWKTAATNSIVLGVSIGLLFGKGIGIFISCWVAERLGIAKRPDGVLWSQIFGVALLGGIGFTMALFIANLAFADFQSMEYAKIGIIGGSLASAIAGLVALFCCSAPTRRTTAR